MGLSRFKQWPQYYWLLSCSTEKLKISLIRTRKGDFLRAWVLLVIRNSEWTRCSLTIGHNYLSLFVKKNLIINTSWPFNRRTRQLHYFCSNTTSCFNRRIRLLAVTLWDTVYFMKYTSYICRRTFYKHPAISLHSPNSSQYYCCERKKYIYIILYYYFLVSQGKNKISQEIF